MADSPLSILQSGIEQWNRWRTAQAGQPTSLAGQDLGCGYYFEGNFSNVDLRGANLQRACLIGANFKNANLTNANLTDAYIDRANFEGATLGGIDLTGTNIDKTNLRQAMSQNRVNDTAPAEKQTGQQTQHPIKHPVKQHPDVASQSVEDTAIEQDSRPDSGAIDFLIEHRIPEALSTDDDAIKNNPRGKSSIVWIAAIAASLAVVLPGIIAVTSGQRATVATRGTQESIRRTQAPIQSISKDPAPSQSLVQASTNLTNTNLTNANLTNTNLTNTNLTNTNLTLVKALNTSSQVWAVETHTRQDGHVLVVNGDADGTITVWDGPVGEVLHTLTGHEDTVRNLAIAPSGSRLVSGSGDGIKVWQPQTGELLYSLPAEPGMPVWSVAISPDEQTLISSDYAGNITSWDLASGEQLYQVSLSGPVWSVAIAPDGKSFVSGSDDNIVRHWNLATGELIESFIGHTDTVRAVAIGADGNTLASGSWDSTIKLWDLATGELTATLDGHSDRVVSLAISPDGKTLASSSVDSTLKLWDLDSQQLSKTLDNSDGWVLAVAFDALESTLVSGGKNKEIKIWQ